MMKNLRLYRSSIPDQVRNDIPFPLKFPQLRQMTWIISNAAKIMEHNIHFKFLLGE